MVNAASSTLGGGVVDPRIELPDVTWSIGAAAAVAYASQYEIPLPPSPARNGYRGV